MDAHRHLETTLYRLVTVLVVAMLAFAAALFAGESDVGTAFALVVGGGAAVTGSTAALLLAVRGVGRVVEELDVRHRRRVRSRRTHGRLS
ncbi:hypothetical protein [Halospeciosus flavus]|uniref:Uncharacterized protein n=1 Tax=Halospeciosus flavus TaxID=3032283 RepID=A0ABD5Z559_9EURY|nr:hypothetical protein [Halospeciosus flavus]